MADDFADNIVPGATADDQPRDNMLPASQNLKSISRPADSDDNDVIQPYAIGYQHDTDDNDDCDNTCIQPYAVGYQDADDNYAGKSSDSETNPTDGEVQPYTDACLQKEDKRDELLQKSEAAATGSSNIPFNTAGLDSSGDDTEASTLVGYDSHVVETRRPLRSSEDDTEASTVAAYDGNTANPDSMYAPNDVHPNPIYPQHAGNTSPIHQQHAMDPNPIYPQNNRNSDLTDEPNPLPEPAGPADSDDNPCIQPYAVRYKHEDGDDENRKHAEGDHNHCIQPYAVRYGHDEDNDKDTERDDDPSFLPYAVRYLQTDDDDDNTAQGAAAFTEQTTETSPTDVDIQPYAVAYMCQDDAVTMASSLEETQTKEPLQKIKTVSNNGNDIQSNMSGRGPSNDDIDTLGFTDDHSSLRRMRHPLKTLHPHPTDVQNVLNPNPMNTVLNALIPNQAYFQTAQIPNQRNAQTAQIRNPIYVANVPQQRAYVIGGIIAGFSFRTRDIELENITSDSFWTTKTTQPWTSYSSQDTNNRKVKLEKILFGGTGKDPGRFHMHSSHGMVVSAANEIFVTDYYNERVQVFSMDGVFLRLFPTVVPGDNENSTMHPSDIAIDRDGFGRAEGQLAYPRSICIDSWGSILIANQGNNRVDMFTRLGKFVRTVANVTGPTGLAVGPNGDLVVTSGNWCNMVAIFPHQMVYP
ncbi:hypothetical protein Bbelb_022300 [Branchiostoma belcheri]|nr:hypothetical protein Bbelb_022300 [Branchiostoma belcheri]